MPWTICGPESILPCTLGTCQLFALQLPPFHLVCGCLCVAAPWAAGEGAGLYLLDLAVLAFAGLMPAGSLNHVACEAQSLSTPAEKLGLYGWIWATNCCLSAFPAPTQTWYMGSSFQGLDWESPLHLTGVGCPLPAQPCGAPVSAVASICELVSASETCGGVSGMAPCSCWYYCRAVLKILYGFLTKR